jgi:hypothetical protein
MQDFKKSSTARDRGVVESNLLPARGREQAGRRRAYQDALEIAPDDLDDIRIVDAVPDRAVMRWRPPRTHSARPDARLRP